MSPKTKKITRRGRRTRRDRKRRRLLRLSARTARRSSSRPARPRKRSLTQVVTASGEVRPRRYVNVGANVSGRLIDITGARGPARQEGPDAGARRGRALRGRALVRARPASPPPGPSWRAAEADLAGAKLAYDRNKRMRDEKLVAESAYDQAEAEYKMKAGGRRGGEAPRRAAAGPARQHRRTSSTRRTSTRRWTASSPTCPRKRAKW